MKIKIDWSWADDGYGALATSFQFENESIIPHFLYFEEMSEWLAERSITPQIKFERDGVYELEHDIPDHLAIEIKLRWSGMEDHADDPEGY